MFDINEFEAHLVQYGLQMMEIGKQETQGHATGRLRLKTVKMKKELLESYQTSLDLIEYFSENVDPLF